MLRKASSGGVKRLGVLLLVVVGVVVAAAPAATTTMAITRNGYVPRNLTIVTGDSVVFANQDSAAHQVVLRPTTGFTCTAGLVIQPGQSSTCTFRTVTRYSVRDANINRQAFRGTITVNAGPPGSVLSLNATPKTLVYGGRSTLSGQLATGLANQRVDIFANDCFSAFVRIATVTTAAGGTYTFTLQPRRYATYEARLRALASNQVIVKVRPRLTLRKLAPRRYRVTLLAGQSYAGKFILFQRLNVAQRRWVTVRSVMLRAGSTLATPLSSTSVSVATFRARVRARSRVRAFLPQSQAGSCYLSRASATIRS
jgi:plastocyanin